MAQNINDDKWRKITKQSKTFKWAQYTYLLHPSPKRGALQPLLIFPDAYLIFDTGENGLFRTIKHGKKKTFSLTSRWDEIEQGT